MKSADVFTPQKLPTVTLVRDHLKKLTETFVETEDEGGKLVRVIGPSKSGKTVFIKSMTAGRLALITGANIENTDQLWLRALNAVGSDLARSETSNLSTTKATAIAGKFEAGISVVKAGTEGTKTTSETNGSTATSQKAIDVFQTFLKELAGTGTWVFIDDFHYIPKPLQSELAGQIKQAVEGGVLIACAAVPFRSEDALRANNDLQGRIADFPFKYWDKKDLLDIAHLGFKALRIESNEAYFGALADEAAGSPQLMQSLCLATCREMNVSADIPESLPEQPIPTDQEFFKRVCQRVASSVDYTTTIDRMKSGPLTRGKQRTSYLLTTGAAADVYPIVVAALAADPPTLHFSYKELQARIASICQKETPHFSDPCFHIAKIANEGHTTDKIDWDQENQMLSIRDPYLLFAMRWN